METQPFDHDFWAKGTTFMKYSKLSTKKPAERVLTVEFFPTPRLHYTGKKKSSKFQPWKDPSLEERAFSIIHVEKGRYKTLNLVAFDADTCSKWVSLFHILMSQDSKDGHDARSIVGLSAWLQLKWDSIDTRRSGVLGLEQLTSLMKSLNLGLSQKEIKSYIKQLNVRALTFVEFERMYRNLKFRPEIAQLFSSLCKSNQSFVTYDEFAGFLTQVQRNNWPDQRCIDTYKKFSNHTNGLMDIDHFAAFLMSSRNSVLKKEKDLPKDFSRPLNEYFVNSSHNTTSRIQFRDAVEAINKYAFADTLSPLILSLEIHCGVEQQDCMAAILTATFGSRLVVEPLHASAVFPTPKELEGRILLKGKLLSQNLLTVAEPEALPALSKTAARTSFNFLQGFKFATSTKAGIAKEISKRRHSSLGPVVSRPAISHSLSSLVVYFRGVPSKSVDSLDLTRELKFNQMLSLNDRKALALYQKNPSSFTDMTKKQFLRVYPSILRVNSSNFDPIHHWLVGTQMVALNFQTYDKFMELNNALFASSGKYGYVAKPSFIQNASHSPAEARTLCLTVLSAQNIQKSKSNRDVDSFKAEVLIEILGHPSDVTKAKTTAIYTNGFNPSWQCEFNFRLNYPEFSFVRFEVLEVDSALGPTLVGSYTLFLAVSQVGYRHLVLNNRQGDPLGICYNQDELDSLYLAGLEPLPLDLQNQLVERIKQDGSILKYVVSKKYCKSLLEHCPKLFQNGLFYGPSQCHHCFLDALLATSSQIRTIDLVTQYMQFKKANALDFLTIYVANIIQQCESSELGAKERTVRLLCLMLLTLHNGGLNIGSLSVVCSPFCLQYSKIKEAVTLYKNDLVVEQYPPKPILVPSTNTASKPRTALAKPATKKRVKLGRLVTGDVSLPLQLEKQKGLQMAQQLWFHANGNRTCGFDLSDWHNNAGQLPPRVSLLSFWGKPSFTSISLIKQTRSDLLILQETDSMTGEKCIRAWSPTAYPNGPWHTDRAPPHLPGLWVMGNYNGDCISLCGRRLLCIESSSEPHTKTLRLYYLADSNLSYFDHDANHIQLQWEQVIQTDRFAIQDIVMNETLVAILFSAQELGHLTKRTVQLIETGSGATVATFPLHVPHDVGFESAGTRICLTRFQLLAYNCNNLVVYDVFRSIYRNEKPRFISVSRLPYVGREVKVDVSDDGTLFLLSPLVQLGEVVIFDVCKQTSSTYLLQNAYQGLHPKSGCWLVYQNQSRFFSESYEVDELNPMLLLDKKGLLQLLPTACEGRSVQSVLEVGSGTGRQTLTLLDSLDKARITCLELSHSMAAIAREKLAVHQQRIEMQVLDAAIAEWPPCKSKARYDLMVSCLVLEHIKDLEAFFGRAAKHSSTLVITTMHPNMFLLNKQASFKRPDGVKVKGASYPHSISDMVNASVQAGYQVERCLELTSSDLPEHERDGMKNATKAFPMWFGFVCSLKH
ncbi:1-phosphatidylinositol 4,5-bisphosphate phosphodiesterase delta-4 [Kappamyces sp. JEL0829]|nr:1-phosphatidylinositol 4,5-bisphosphate phosphodiesterase delta-4 [Kappamyces sp. JEL0829]